MRDDDRKKPKAAPRERVTILCKEDEVDFVMSLFDGLPPSELALLDIVLED